ncbi:iron-containing alcohol dehydrogenase [Marinobacterium aestuariivivens]|uniref:Iron-containing alcohol dehydrogenase n=1 Tax=Marinobacterium aestuariivivens TaxID=1698799 RepID=A0ABW1ZTT7_9GAMM
MPLALAAFGRRALLVTGGRSFLVSPHWQRLQQGLDRQGIEWEQLGIAGEPGPEQVDRAVARFADASIEMVVGIGGGSALDAAKAIAALLPTGRSVLDHLEGVGPQLPYEGPALPFIAVPTTAGTGSEMTRNAVLTRPGSDGFKKSFRDERLLARLALVDPQLLHSCPPRVMLGNALDALTQLLESYVATRASAFTDALAESGLRAFAAGFRADPQRPVGDYSCLAYASMLSGICLAQAGLGSVHGMASPLGAWFPIPHGLACGTLLAEATRVNVQALRERNPESPALAKYARVAGWLGDDGCSDADALVTLLSEWTGRCNLPRLASFGMVEADIERVAAASGGSSMKTNPVVLTLDEIATVLHRRL